MTTSARLRRWGRALAYLVVEGVAGTVSLLMLIAGLVLAPFLLLGPGWLVAPTAVRALRGWTALARQRAGRFTGEPVGERYPPIPADPTFEDLRRLVSAPSTLRDAGWVAVHALVAPAAALLAVGLPAGALNSLLVPAYWQAMPADEPVSNLYPVTSWWGAAAMPLIGLGYAAVALWLVPAMARGMCAVTLRLLAPTRASQLAQRVSALTASRAAALDAHAAELRRIERDLHDGAQNKLVGVVMMLGIAERSLTTNPEQALPQLRRAQDAATDALAGLRTLVHDIYPPILDELGLDGALSALAGRCPVPCALDVDGLRRAPAAVESAAYFVAAEGLTNVAKHSGAGRVVLTATTDVGPSGEVLRIVVADDGRGGAAARAGGGLAGIRRRAEAFEGSVELVSPDGGPTTLRVELPCGS
ncbi:sensor histidine kinase [Rhodococcus tukisamuensis]|uniref:histidine kinase n=1 Tax=Rhodococcus tukisamuensis TaxID=168276 RepID=A0A1G7B0B8_9NOCA|nr:sensor histidine kinase [Rhodococcus tukisamuensis]SDE20558.1 Histidine kinase [Rhodococcus tukisamuensis]